MDIKEASEEKNKAMAKELTFDDQLSSNMADALEFLAKVMDNSWPVYNTDPMEQFEKDDEAYMASIQNPPPHKHYADGLVLTNKDKCCPNPHKYKNIISKSLKFYSCSNCGADLGDIT